MDRIIAYLGRAVKWSRDTLADASGPAVRHRGDDDTMKSIISTMQKSRILLSWSSGKDAAWTLHVLRQSAQVEVVGLLTTLDGASDRVAMHAVRRVLLERQAEEAELPLLTASLPWPCTNAEYEAVLSEALADARERLSVTHVAFGDLFLSDVRAYRERQLAGTGLTPLFPLWGRPTHTLAREMVTGGLRATLTCVDPKCLPASFAGRAFDQSLLDALPEGIDPCGERGEFHTFAWAGPMFRAPLDPTVGKVVKRDGFVFADLSTDAAE